MAIRHEPPSRNCAIRGDHWSLPRFPSGGTIHSSAVRLTFIRAESPNPGLRVQTLRLRYRRTPSASSCGALACPASMTIQEKPLGTTRRSTVHNRLMSESGETSCSGAAPWQLWFKTCCRW
jgi:hypothetical protein